MTVDVSNFESAASAGGLAAALRPLLAAPALPIDVAGIRAAIPPRNISVSVFNHGPGTRFSSPFDQMGNPHRVQSPSGLVLASSLVMYQTPSAGRQGSFAEAEAGVWANGRRLVRGRDYFTGTAFGATRVYAYASALPPEPCEVIVEMKSNPVTPDYAVFNFQAPHSAGFSFRAEAGRGGVGTDAASHSLYRRRAGEQHYKMMTYGSEYVAASGANGVTFTTLVTVNLGDRLCPVNRFQYWAADFVVPPQALYAINPLIRVALHQRVGAELMPLPIGHEEDLNVYLDGLKMTLGADYVVKPGLNTPGDPPYLQLANSLPPLAVLTLETGRAFNALSLVRRGSNAKGLLDLADSPLPLVAGAEEAYSKGRRLSPSEVQLFNDSLALLGGHGPDGLEIYHVPYHTPALDQLSANYEAALPSEVVSARASGSAVYEAVFLAAHPQSDLVDDGIAGPALGTDVSDQILFARYLKYGPGGEHPADGDLVDSNDSQDAIVFADYSVDANATDFPDLGYSGAPVDSNNAGWTFSSRPADPASTEAIYAQEVYSYTSANILETEV